MLFTKTFLLALLGYCLVNAEIPPEAGMNVVSLFKIFIEN